MVEMHAPLETVWDVVVDLPSYPAWNPFIRRVDFQPPLGVGSAMTLELDWAKFRGPRHSPERVLRMDGPIEGQDYAVLAYSYDGWLARQGLIRAVRTQEIWRVGDGGVRYRTVEVFAGPGRALVPVRAVRDGFERQATALIARAQALHLGQ